MCHDQTPHATRTEPWRSRCCSYVAPQCRLHEFHENAVADDAEGVPVEVLAWQAYVVQKHKQLHKEYATHNQKTHAHNTDGAPLLHLRFFRAT